MVLVDTSVWIDHFRRGDRRLAGLLQDGLVLMHPVVLGELALGTLPRRGSTLQLLRRLPGAVEANHPDVLSLVEARRLHGRGLGYADVQLLAASLITPDAVVWTRDKRLAEAADRCGVGWR